MAKNSKRICYLCGQVIETKSKDDPMGLSMDHVPPRQFYMKHIRATQNLNLDKAPSHKSCNEAYKEDEEYFYVSMYPIVAKNYPPMETLYFQDIIRRSQQPQTPTKLRKILSTAVTVTEGGIHLPNGMRRLTLDRDRIERIIVKIARGILFLSTERYFGEQQIICMSSYDKQSKIPDYFLLALRLQPFRGICPDVFAFSLLSSGGLHLLLILFWKAFMFSVTVKDCES
jgi:hypothetical protein